MTSLERIQKHLFGFEAFAAHFFTLRHVRLLCCYIVNFWHTIIMGREEGLKGGRGLLAGEQLKDGFYGWLSGCCPQPQSSQCKWLAGTAAF